MIDTSVWIDFLNGANTPQVATCVRLLEEGAPLGLTDIILTEILQGLRSDAEATKVETRLRKFPILRLETLDDFAAGAALYRTARRAGITIRKSLDCLIAATCIKVNASILHADRDFDQLASCTPLRCYVEEGNR